MYSELTFVPKILLCGDEAEFFARVGNRPFKLVGHLEVFGIVNGQQFNLAEDGKVFFGGRLQEFIELRKFLADGAVDFVIFNNLRVYSIIRNYAIKQGFVSTKIITLEFFKALPVEFFYDIYAEQNILAQLKNLNVRTLLDVDGYFERGQLLTKPDDFTEIDCIIEEPLLPIKENIYAHTYKDFAQVGFKRYDAALIIEREPQDFFPLFTMLENFTDFVITFARAGSDLAKYLLAAQKRFANLRILQLESGTWFLIERRTKPQDFCVYVVTYKDIKLDEPPEGYKIIQGGREQGKDLGYLGDDTGDNISRLNVYLNELTALYWMWKNTSHTVIGLNHYRRFFTESDDTTFASDKILTRDAALKILDRYDMIISTLTCEMIIQRELIQNDCGKQLTTIAEKILKKHLLRAQPDYAEAFDEMMESLTLYRSHLFITRKNILDAYCTWLFSFLIDATEEILRTVNLAAMPFSPRRLVAFFAERMLTLWLKKNRLRIKELNFMFIRDL